MSSPMAAPGAATPQDAAASLLALLSPARAAASRRNGAKSRGPKTAEGKARSSQNALKHGLRAAKHVVLPDENAAELAALEAALEDELAPEGALQGLLASRIARAAWRLERADRIEVQLFDLQAQPNLRDWGPLGLALVRDGNGPRSFATLLRYRGAAMAELTRALRTLQALQAEQAQAKPSVTTVTTVTTETPIEPEAHRIPHEIATFPAVDEAEAVQAAVGGPAHPSGRGSALAPVPRAPQRMPIEPEAPSNPCETAAVPTAGKAVASVVASALPEEPARGRTPIEPEARKNPGEIAPARAADAASGRPHEDLAHEVAPEMRHPCATDASFMRHDASRRPNGA